MIPSPPIALFTLGPLTIHIYGIIIACAVLSAYKLAIHLAPSRQISIKEIDNYFFITFPIAIVCARTYHVLANWGYYGNHVAQIVAIWNGGLGIFGGIIGATVTLIVICARNKQSFLKLFDLISVTLPLAQAIGRWGNYFNQELFGTPTNLPWGLFVDKQFRPERFQASQTFHPTFLYESLLNIINFGVLYIIYKKTTNKPGIITSLYCINYGFIRFCVDIIKIDPDPSSPIGQFSLSQAFSLVFIMLGVLLLVKIKLSSAQ